MDTETQGAHRRETEAEAGGMPLRAKDGRHRQKLGQGPGNFSFITAGGTITVNASILDVGPRTVTQRIPVDSGHPVWDAGHSSPGRRARLPLSVVGGLEPLKGPPHFPPETVSSQANCVTPTRPALRASPACSSLLCPSWGHHLNPSICVSSLASCANLMPTPALRPFSTRQPRGLCRDPARGTRW